MCETNALEEYKDSNTEGYCCCNITSVLDETVLAFRQGLHITPAK